MDEWSSIEDIPSGSGERECNCNIVAQRIVYIIPPLIICQRRIK